MTRRLLSVLAALVLMVAACADDDTATDDPGGDPGQAGAPTTEPTEPTVEAPDSDPGGGDAQDGPAVTIQDFDFEPSSVEVAAGGTVTWTNEDGVTHTVTAGEPGSAEDTFDQTLDAGDTATIGFDDPGTYAYFCAIHPSMTAEVVVTS